MDEIARAAAEYEAMGFGDDCIVFVLACHRARTRILFRYLCLILYIHFYNTHCISLTTAMKRAVIKEQQISVSYNKNAAT